jgi:hypothetical protein
MFGMRSGCRTEEEEIGEGLLNCWVGEKVRRLIGGTLRGRGRVVVKIRRGWTSSGESGMEREREGEGEGEERWEERGKEVEERLLEDRTREEEKVLERVPVVVVVLARNLGLVSHSLSVCAEGPTEDNEQRLIYRL